jgi:chromatin modification-related protein VID21
MEDHSGKNLADWCAEWSASKPEDRVLLQVRRRPLVGQAQSDPVRDVPATVDGDIAQVEVSDVPDSQATPDLVSSAEVESLSDGVDDEERHHHYLTLPSCRNLLLGA